MRAVGRRSLLMGASATALTGLLAGCNGGAVGPTPGPTDRPVPTNRTLRGQIVLATERRPPDSALEALIRAYQQHHPDVEVTWEAPEGDDYAEWLRAQLKASDIRPDIVSGSHWADYSGFVDLEQYRRRTNPYTGNAWSSDYDFALYRRLNVRGQRTWIGTESVRPLWFYNTGMLDQVAAPPPTNWEDLIAVCESLQASDLEVVPTSTSYETAVRRWLAAVYFDQYHADWVNQVRANEGDWNFDPDVDGAFEWRPEDTRLHRTYTFSPQRFFRALRDEEIGYDTTAMAALATNLVELLGPHTNSDFLEITDHYTPFLQQQAAMMLGDSSMLTMLRDDLEDSDVESFDWDTFEFPAMTGTDAMSVLRLPEDVGGYCVSVVDKGSEQAVLVMDFLMFWLSQPGYVSFVDAQAEAQEFVPDGPPLVKEIEYPNDIQDLLERVRPTGVIAPSYGDFWLTGRLTGSGDPGDPQIAADLQRLFSRLIDGDLRPTGYAQELQRYMTQNLDTLLRAEGLTEADIAAPQRPPAGV